jgi:hypothetical protein
MKKPVFQRFSFSYYCSANQSFSPAWTVAAAVAAGEVLRSRFSHGAI